MLILLTKYRPKDTTLEEWQKLWDNASFVLAPFAAALREMKVGKGVVYRTDFENKDVFGLMAYDAGYLKAIDDVLAFLPKNN